MGDGVADWELFLLRLRYRTGRPVHIAGNRPALLDDPGAVWVVYAGQVDIFAVEVGADGVPGPRRYLFSAEAGDAVFGLAGPAEPGGSQTDAGLTDAASSGAGAASGHGALRLLVSGPPATQLLRTTVAGLEQLGRAPEFRPLVASLLDGWITRLSGALVRGLPPRTFHAIDAGSPLAVRAGSVVRSQERVLWLGQAGASGAAPISFLGLRGQLVPGEQRLLPLAPAAWGEADTPATLAARETGGLLADGSVWPELGHFHVLAHAILVEEAARQQQAAGDRQAAATEVDATVFSAALTALTEVLAHDSPGALTGRASRDPLLAACQLVAQAQGLGLVQRPAHDAASDPLASIARASRLRTRTVTLRGRWWSTDSGPMVGYRADGSQPVALLREARGYVLVDPVTGTRAPVDAALAATLSPRADTFYRSFASRALSARELLIFGLRGCRADLLRLLLVALGVGLLGVAVPVAAGLLFDVVIPGAHLGLLVQVGLGLALAALMAGIFEVVREIALLRLGARFQASLEPAIMDRLLDLPGRFYRDYTAGDLASRALAVSAIRDALTGPVLSALLASLFSGFSLLLLFWYAPRLALVALALLAPLALVFAVSSVRLVRQQRLLADVAGRLSSLVLQLLTGIATLRLAGAERRAFAQWAGLFAEQRRASYASRAIVNRQAIFTASFLVLALLVLFAAVVTSPSAPPSVGAFVAFITAYGQVVTGALALLQATSSLLQVLPAYERARPIFDAVPEVDATRDDPGELSGALDIDQLTFRYDPQGPPILDNVSLHCRPGEFVALVGPSGSGKSTLLRLLLGFEQPESGAIFFDGRDLCTLDLRLVRRQIGSVLQNSRLLPGDIASNILGASTLTLDDAWEAARLAGLTADIEQMPMGMHTVIGEGADTLSGGQRQRLAIARALVHRPRMVFFDEATSALDNRTQEIVSESLRNLAATRVVIAHRLSTIVNADRIYVLQRGRIVETGTYRELMQRRGVFSELARRQIV